VGEVRERRQAVHPPYIKPELVTDHPNQVWSWDITKLLGPEKWTYARSIDPSVTVGVRRGVVRFDR
jgi:hypothetical protein